MFYSKALLSKKGPLGTVWAAAFCRNRKAALTRDQVARTDIVASVGNDSASTPAMREQSPSFHWIFGAFLVGIRVGQEGGLSNLEICGVGLEQWERGDGKGLCGGFRF